MGWRSSSVLARGVVAESLDERPTRPSAGRECIKPSILLRMISPDDEPCRRAWTRWRKVLPLPLRGGWGRGRRPQVSAGTFAETAILFWRNPSPNPLPQGEGENLVSISAASCAGVTPYVRGHSTNFRAIAITRCASLHRPNSSNPSKGAHAASVTSVSATGSPDTHRAAKSMIV
jgi:hypothetical protein